MRGRLYGHHFADHPDTFACRRAAVMAVQLRLGVLSEWRPGTGAADYYHPVSGGPAVGAPAPGKIFFLNSPGTTPGTPRTPIYALQIISTPHHPAPPSGNTGSPF